MDDKKLLQLKNHRFVINLFSFLFVMILTVVLTSTLTLAAFGNNQEHLTGLRIGTIILNDTTQSFEVRDNLGQILNKVKPGDNIKVLFNIQNMGTAAMFIRFKVQIKDKNLSSSLDMSVFEINLESAKYTKEVNGTPTEFNSEYVEFNFGNEDIWMVRKNYILGATNELLREPADYIVLNINFPQETMTNEYKGANIGIYLTVQTVQMANNGTQQDVTLPGYNVVWPH